MALTMPQISPVAHWPWVLGGVRQRNVAALIATFCPPPPAHLRSGGRGVEALLLAMLDGQHALSQGGARLEARGRFPRLQPGRARASRHADRLGQRREALLAAQRKRVCGASARTALEGAALSTPWRPQATTPLTLSGASAEAVRPVAGLGPPRPAAGHRPDGPEDLTQGLRSLGVRRAGLPRRVGRREGKTRDRPETPVALAACLARGRDGGRGLVAARTAAGTRPRG
jgi:hypothetical protein